ncbi:two-component system response regulator [Azonexus sp.]|jgi:putative two-component system response regulator|uniref:response regulator n=1 Tax=Azonexus sp. TaxID=1872668 RepID=UPI00282A2806|nr:two-component system response regulator [Azonexus sp.]MDR1995466.1 two-component system response regulator [Azonexus sp.]
MATDVLDFAERQTVLVVDDTPDNLSLMSALLKDHYKVKVAHNGDKALKVVRNGSPPDLILLDIMMPGLSGYDVCRELKADPATCHIPIIFLTAMAAVEDEKKGLEMGAADYITKPINPPILLARVQTQLNLKAATDFLRNQNAFLEQEVVKRTREVMAIQDVTVLAMASMAETRDSETGNHIRRTQFYVKALAKELQGHPRFSRYLTDRNIDLLFKSAPLHDIGKVGIPDHILLKPGRLEPHEFEVMKTHTTLGRDAIEHAEQALGMKVDFLATAKEIAYSHQEKWDGSGYPQGIGADDIPISARLMAVADVYDALISRRVYKNPMPHDQAVTIILEGRGSHFDLDIVDAFSAIQDNFLAISQRYADSDRDIQKKADYLELAISNSIVLSSKAPGRRDHQRPDPAGSGR